MKGDLYAFEGINGCGKTTVLHEVAKKLRERHGEGMVVTLCNPTQGPIGQEIRQFVHEQRVKGFPRFFSPNDATYAFATRLAVLFAADRLGQQPEIEYHINEGRTVLCDRYALSTLVYQCAMIGDVGLDTNFMRMVHAMHAGLIKPTDTLVFDVPVDVARTRLAVRGEQNDDRMMTSIEAAARSMYLDVKSTDPHGERNTIIADLTGSVEHIDANRPLEAVVADALNEIDWHDRF